MSPIGLPESSCLAAFRHALRRKASAPFPLPLPLPATPEISAPLRKHLPRVAASWADVTERRIQTASFSFQKVRVFLLTLALLALPLGAFGQGDWSEYNSVSFSLSHARTRSTVNFVDLWTPAPADTAIGFSGWHGVDLFYPIHFSFVRTIGNATGLRDSVFAFFSKRLPSRLPSGAWAEMHAGYGDLFAHDTVGRGHMNGAGLQDPETAYVKLTFRF